MQVFPGERSLSRGVVSHYCSDNSALRFGINLDTLRVAQYIHLHCGNSLFVICLGLHPNIPASEAPRERFNER
jgi:hypothetical protein